MLPHTPNKASGLSFISPQALLGWRIVFTELSFLIYIFAL